MMKLEQKYLDICYINAMIMQYTDILKAEGFTIKPLPLCQNPHIDLYAYKGDEKRIYEFKYYKNTSSILTSKQLKSMQKLLAQKRSSFTLLH